MKKFKKSVLIFLSALMLMLTLALSVSAASVTYYQTAKANVPIWSAANSDSKKIKTISSSGTVVKIVDSKRNIYGKLWYKLSDGTWVYSENVKKHTHSFAGGVCTTKSCGYEYPLNITSMNADFVVVNSGGAKVWSKPYSTGASKHLRTASYNSVLKVTGKVSNAHGNVWYRISDGNWVYSDFIKQRVTISFNVNGGYGAPNPQPSTSGTALKLSTTTPKRVGYIFQGWSTSSGSSTVTHKPGTTYTFSKNTTLYAVWKSCSHNFDKNGGICRNCGYNYPLNVTSMNADFIVVNSGGAKIWSMPYSTGNSKHLRTASYNSVLKVTGKVSNAHGNLWYKLSDGNWVYSDFIKQCLTVSFNANGGYGAPNPQTVVSGNSLPLSSTTPKKSGCVFQGWSTSSGSSTVTHKPGTTYTFSKDTTLYAVWNTCTHNFDKNGGICRNCGYEYPLNTSLFFADFVVVNSSGAKLWTKPYSTGTSQHIRTAPQNSVLSVVAKTINAHGHVWYLLSGGYWVYSDYVRQRLTISFNANGGSGAPEPQTAASGISLKLSSTTPKKVGYAFQGWSTSSGSSTVTHKAGTAYTFTKDTTLHAVWKACTHNFDSNGGICKNCGYEYKLNITSMSADFKVVNDGGANVWSKPYSTGTSKHLRTVSKNAVVKITGKVKNAHNHLWYQLSDGNWIYSSYVKQCITVSFKANGGSSAPDAQKSTSGTSLKLSTKKPTKVGYVFQGWSTSSEAKKVTHKPGTAYTFTKSTTLYAVWDKCSHKKYSGGICTTCKYEYKLKETEISKTFVVTNDNGAPAWSRPYSENSKKVKTYDNKTALKVIAKVKNINEKGKATNVWYKLENGTWVFSGNVTERFMIKYNANGGKNAPSNQYFISGKSATVTKSKPEREQYVFKGWATSSDSKKVAYKAGDKYSKEKNLYLYAIWEKCTHTYDDVGYCTTCKYTYPIVATKFSGTYVVTEKSGAVIRSKPYLVGSKSRTAKYMEPLTVVATAVNAHKNVWYKLSDGNWVFADKVAYGHKVTYDANGGKKAPSSTGFVSGKLTVSSDIPTRSGYTFMGWSTSKTAKTASYKSGDTYNVKKDITLYAVWSSCDHNYKNNYGICKNCKAVYPIVVTTTSDTVYKVDNKNGTVVYKNPYSKPAEKVKTADNKNFVLVTGWATNANGEKWCKLKDGTWTKKDNLKKCDTYDSFDTIPHKYALVMIGSSSFGGSYSIKKIGGVSFINFYNKNNSFFINQSAFNGKSTNSQLSSVNKKLTDEVNKRSSATEEFVYTTKKTEKIIAPEYACAFSDADTKEHNHIIWEITALTATAGISNSDSIIVSCQNNGEGTIKLTYCCYAKTIERKLVNGSAIYPKFTVSVTPDTKDGEAVGWFTDFNLEGYGYKKEKFKVEDYIDLGSCAIKSISSIGKLVTKPTPKTVYDAIKDTWSFVTEVDKKTGSASYTTEKENPSYLTYTDDKTNTVYRTYEFSIKSPINLREKGDILKATVNTYKLNKNQKLSVKLSISKS